MSSTGMRLTHVLLGGLLANTACSDGVGTPIREALETELDGGTAGGGADASIPRTCAEVENWDAEIAATEQQLLDLINDLRAAGIRCGDRPPERRPRLEFARELRCSGRLHSMDMALNGFTRREGSDGLLPDERMKAAGFDLVDEAELLADEEPSVERALADLPRNTRGSCEALTDPDFTHIGVGRFMDYWTVDLAQARAPDGQQTP